MVRERGAEIGPECSVPLLRGAEVVCVRGAEIGLVSPFCGEQKWHLSARSPYLAFTLD